MGTPLMQSWAEMVGALGTAAAFAVAARVYWRQQRDRRSDESNQARLVYAFVEGDSSHTRLEVRNDSEAPVFRVISGLWHNRMGSEPEHDLGERLGTLVPHRQVEVWRWRTEILTDHYGNVDSIAAPEQIIDHQIRFVDAHGREWTRDGERDPRRVIEPGRLQRRLRSAATWLRQRRRGRRSSPGRR